MTDVSGESDATPEIPNARRRKRKSDKYWIAGIVIIFLIVTCTVLYLILEKKDIRPVKCDVKSAHAEWSEGGGGTTQTSTASILVKSRKCGKFSLELHQSYEQLQKTASRIRPGQTYEFDMGWSSRYITPHIPKLMPSAVDYRPVG